VYDASQNQLIPVSESRPPSRSQVQQVHGGTGALVFVADYAKYPAGTESQQALWSAAHTGFIGQNVYLYCASEGLGAHFYSGINRDALKRKFTVAAGSRGRFRSGGWISKRIVRMAPKRGHWRSRVFCWSLSGGCPVMHSVYAVTFVHSPSYLGASNRSTLDLTIIPTRTCGGQFATRLPQLDGSVNNVLWHKRLCKILAALRLRESVGQVVTHSPQPIQRSTPDRTCHHPGEPASIGQRSTTNLASVARVQIYLCHEGGGHQLGRFGIALDGPEHPTAAPAAGTD